MKTEITGLPDLAAAFRKMAENATLRSQMNMSKIHRAEWLATAAAYQECAEIVENTTIAEGE